MRLFVFDCEVFKWNWIFVFKNVETGEYTVIHNDNGAVKDFIEQDDIVLCGFNNKNYDNHILKAVIRNADNATVKDINDFVIKGNKGWEHPFIRANKAWFDSFDLMDDMQQGLSLKAIEAHLGIDIEETEVDFNMDRPLTDSEIENTIRYCKYDVDATEKLLHLRENYLNNKLMLGRIKGIPDTKALYMTNAKLTATYLDATPVETHDERDYKVPKNLLTEYIPNEVFEFFARMYDKSIPDEELFNGKYVFNIGECECTLGFGGIHGAILNHREKATDIRAILNDDVGAYYPHLMTINGYTSRAMPHPEDYATMLETRMKAKKSGDKATANALKLVANTTYGAMLNEHNPLYDAKNARSVCISGQLFLLELAMHTVTDCKTAKIIQLNTDGIMISIDKSELPIYSAIREEWQKRTGFELEQDHIAEIIQSNVNNYIEVATDGNYKIKGGMLVRGIAPAGAFNINNNATIVPKAMIDYFVKGIPVEQTIAECNDLLSYQLIAKASNKYTDTFQIVNGIKTPVQRCNRVYAAKDRSLGTLYKVHAERGTEAKISGLPAHCIIDNKNQLTIDSIDKQWYVRLAKKQINDFLGIEVKKPNGRKLSAMRKRINKILEENKIARN